LSGNVSSSWSASCTLRVTAFTKRFHGFTEFILGFWWGYNIGRKNLKIPESVNQRRTDNTMAKGKSRKGQTTIYKTLHIKLKIE
jgi:hypothetical protein